MDRRTDAPARSLRSRLLLTGLAVMAPVLLGAGLWVLLLTRSTNDYRELATEVTRETHHSVVLLDNLNAAGGAGRNYLLEGTPSARLLFHKEAARVDRGLSNPGAYDEPAERIALVGIARPWRQAEATFARRGEEDAFSAQIDLAASGLERLMSDSQAELVEDVASVDDRASFNWLVGLGGVALALLIAAVVAQRMGRRLTAPLEQLADAARSLGSGHLGHRVAIDSTTELNEVGATFNAMAAALGEQRAELERHAFADSLTGLANRSLFEDRTRHALERLQNGERIAVIVVDVDAFKLVNDGLGHACGDALLRHAAERMTGAVRPTDTLARLGSDEFAVLLETVRGPDDALGAADRVRRAFEEPFALRSSEVRVTVSVGIALSGDASADAVELLRRADMAMYRVKQHGRNSVEFFDPGMDDQAAERLEMANALRLAAGRGELEAHYQPIFDLDTGEVRAAEALLRWNRPGRGTVAPLDFIPLAEKTGEIVSLGSWILRAACAEARDWQEAGIRGVPVTVNVSARQLLDARFESVVAEALATTGLDPSGLILEVTES
jgi:diguanylate cyclase (GGDEF)-like protein